MTLGELYDALIELHAFEQEYARVHSLPDTSRGTRAAAESERHWAREKVISLDPEDMSINLDFK